MPSILENLSIKTSRSSTSKSSKGAKPSSGTTKAQVTQQQQWQRSSKSNSVNGQGGNEAMFGMIFEDRNSNGNEDKKHHRLNLRRNSRKVVTSPSSAPGQKRKSRRYIRPIFKEPGTKIGVKEAKDSESEASEYEVRHPLVRDLLGDMEKINKKKGSSDQSLIQPQSHALQRMKTIVGRSREGQFDTNMYLNRRDDQLALRMRSPALQRTSSELSTIRRDVVKIMSDFIAAPAPSPSPSKPRAPNHLTKYNNHGLTRYDIDYRDDLSMMTRESSSTLAEF